MKKFIYNGIIASITAILIQTIGIGFNIYISNKVGTECIGIFQIIMAIYMFAITLSTSGINLTTTRIVSEDLAITKESINRKNIQACLKYSLFFGIITCVLLIIFAEELTTNFLHSKVSPTILYLLAISLPFSSISFCINGYFSGTREIAKNSSQQILNQIIKIIATTFFINLFLPAGINYACLSLVLGTVISEIISSIYFFILYLLTKKEKHRSFSLEKNIKKRIYKIAFPIALTGYLRSGLSTLKQILIPLRLEKNGMSCEIALSNYGIISGMVMPILLFPHSIIQSFSYLLIPEYAKYNVTKDYKKIDSVSSRIFKLISIFSIATIGFFILFADELSLLLYNNLQTSLYIKTLCPLVILMYLDSVVDCMLKGLDKQLSVMGCNILDLFVSIVCIYFLLPIWGVGGYIAVIFISEFLNTSISINQLLHVTDFKIDFNNWILKPCIGAFLSGIFVLLLNFEFSLFTFIIKAILFIVFYLTFTFYSSLKA